jgi:hypothetical protein
MKNKTYETFVNKNGTAFYVGGLDWLPVFLHMKKTISITMNTMVLETDDSKGLILKRTANVFDGELKILEPVHCTSADVIDAVMTSKQDVYEYHAVLDDKYELDSILPSSFVIRGNNVIEFVQNAFRPCMITELLELAQTKPEHILTVENGKVVDISERITLDIDDHIYSELTRVAELDAESGV